VSPATWRLPRVRRIFEDLAHSIRTRGISPDRHASDLGEASRGTLFRARSVPPRDARSWRKRIGWRKPGCDFLSRNFGSGAMGGAGDCVGARCARWHPTASGHSARGLQSPQEVALKTPSEVFRTASYSSDLLTSRGDHEVNVVGRLKPGVSVTAAQAASAQFASLGKQFPDSNRYFRAAIAPCARPAGKVSQCCGRCWSFRTDRADRLRQRRQPAHGAGCRTPAQSSVRMRWRRAPAPNAPIADREPGDRRGRCVAGIVLGRLLMLGLTVIAQPASTHRERGHGLRVFSVRP